MVNKNNKNLIIGVLVVLVILLLFGVGFGSYGMMGYEVPVPLASVLNV